MSQRRQEARQAKQARRREERTRPRVSKQSAGGAPPVVSARATAVTRPPQSQTFWTARNRLIIFGGLVGLLVVAVIGWVFLQANKPLPGTGYPTQGNNHLADATTEHDAYNSNPPTSGWHLPPVPRPGIYTNPIIPEGVGHFMEHGGVWVLYNCPQGCAGDVSELTKLVNGAIDRNKPVALGPFPTMESKFAVVGWQRLLTLDTLDLNQINGFVNRISCRYNPEGGPYCSGVRGKVATTAADSRNSTLPVTVNPISVFPSQTAGATPAPSASPRP